MTHERSLRMGLILPKKEKVDIAAIKLDASNTFKLISDEYTINKAELEGRASVTLSKSKWRLSLFDHDLGARPVAEIKPAEFWRLC